MDLNGFINKIKKINENNYGFGNDVLYTMAENSIKEIERKDILSGSMWLIGRSYAASPQRRNYGGKSKTGEEYKDKDGNIAIRPIWPVLSSNDGREEFFDKISCDLLNNKKIIREIKNANSKFEYNRDNLLNGNSEINENSKDYKALITGIKLVLEFNIELRDALEKYDKVPKNHKFKKEKVVCSNHISFCSKFLHFYLPNTVYIFDNYAKDGANFLFENKKGVCFDDGKRDDSFDSDILKIFKDEKELSNNLIKQINNEIKSINEDDDINKLGDENEENNDTDKSKANDYIKHCVYSYIMGLFIQEELINKKALILKEQTKNSKKAPMSRLTDAIFLNIKKPYTKKETDYIKELKKIYGITI